MAPSRLLSNVTLALAALAALLLQVALYDRQPVIWPGWAQLSVAAMLAIIGTRWQRQSAIRHGVLIAALASLPFVWNLATRSVLRVGDPSEVLTAYMLRNLMFGLAAARHESRSQHLAGLASFFLVLFSFLWSMNLTTTLLLVTYALVGMWWLLGCYWDGIQGRFADKSEQAIPVRPALLAIGTVVLLVLAALPIARSSRVTTALHGFFPSSGGSQWSDEFAQGGVGDGNQMVAAKDDASSFGAVESELFLESRMPSLYDVVNELGEPSKINKKRGRQRAIPLASTSMKANHKQLGQNQQANREFDTVRTRPRETPKTSADHKSPALLQVRGRVPVHLGLYAYDTWDGRKLSSSGGGEGVFCKLDKHSPDGRAWLRLSLAFPAPIFNYTERHQVRVINLSTDRVPAPPNLTAVNLDRLHTANMFRFASDGVLAIDSDAIPQLTVLNVESRRLPRSAQPSLKRSTAPKQMSRIARCAKAWTEGVEAGWPQVVAIRDRLRREYQLDPTAMVPEDCDDSVEHFLFESKRGPDYLFATSAALLTRSLGYEVRVRSGLYARPENYERLADLTSIYKEDVHFWFEVEATQGLWFDRSSVQRSGSWVTVDPSPGFEALYTPDTLFAQWVKSVVNVWRAVVVRPLQATLAVVLLAAVVWLRVALLDRLVTAWWGVACRLGDARHQVLATVRLLERRAWLRNQPRPPGTTIGRWQLHDATASPESVSSLADFQQFALWAMYSDGAPATAPAERIQASCHAAARSALRTRIQPTTTR